jgi:predicted ArsR family transcriptional regulator
MKRHAPEEHCESLPLFDRVEPRARATDPQTSHDAATSMVEHANAHRVAMLRALQEAPDGLTCDEIETQLGWRYATASRRMNELVAKGLAVGTIDTRPTRSGRSAVVYFAKRRVALEEQTEQES